MVENRANIEDLMNDNEKTAFSKFMRKHRRCKSDSAIGGDISVEVTATGLGYTFIAKCNVCRDQKNITDVSCW